MKHRDIVAIRDHLDYVDNPRLAAVEAVVDELVSGDAIDLSSILESIDTLDAKIDTLDAKIDALDTKVDELEDKVDDLE